MATSALKSASMAPPPDILGADEVYATQYQKAMDAEKKLMDLLEQKQTKNVSPSWLAFAGEMLDPGRTGTFGEALGRAAKGYAAGQEVEQKRQMEDAAMRMQLEQMRLDRALRSQGLKTFESLGKRPGVTEGQVPEGASGPALNVRGTIVTPDDIAKIMYTNPDLGKALETGYKLRLESIKLQPGFIFNAATGEFTAAPGQEAKPEPVPEVGGTLLMPAADAQRLREARAKKDAKTVYEIIDLYEKGVGPRPMGQPPAAAAPVEPAAPAPTEPEAVAPKIRDMTIEGRSVQTAKDKAAAEKFAATQAENTTKFLSNADDQRSARAAAAENIKLLSQNPRVVGLFNKPGVGNAIWGLIQETLNVQVGSGQTGVSVNIPRADLQAAVMKVDPKITEQDLTDLSVIVSNLARLELGLRRSTYAGSGMGSVSNLEGQPIKDIIGNRYDTPAALLKKMKMAAKSFEYDMEVADAFRRYDESQGGNKTLEDFKRTKEYKKLSNEYDTWMNKNLGIPMRKKGGAKASLNANDIIDIAKKRGLIK